MGLCPFSPLHYTLKQSVSIRGKESGPFTSVGHAILSEGLPASYLCQAHENSWRFHPRFKGQASGERGASVWSSPLRL